MAIAFVVWIVCFIIAIVLARGKNRSTFAWGVAAVFFGIFAIVVLVCLKRVPTIIEQIVAEEDDPRNSKICPKCAERVKSQAFVCRFCSHEFD